MIRRFILGQLLSVCRAFERDHSRLQGTYVMAWIVADSRGDRKEAITFRIHAEDARLHEFRWRSRAERIAKWLE